MGRKTAEKVPESDGPLESMSGDDLRQMLEKLAGEVDHDGLVFLTRQAQVLLHNQKVEELNKKIGEIKVERSAGSRMRRPTQEIEIVERGEGKHFFIVVNSFRIYFTLEEMRHLVRISHAAEDERDAARNSGNWPERIASLIRRMMSR